MDWEKRIGYRLKLRDLHILAVVVECGSMAGAARRLSVSNPVISKAVAGLEHTLNARLLERDAHGIHLTAEGRALLDGSIAAFDELRQAAQIIETLSDPSAGEVKVGCSLAIATGLIPPIIARLVRRFPRISVELVAGEPPASCRALEERRVDLAIVHMHAPIQQQHIHIEILYDDPYVIVAGAQSSWARRRRMELVELMNEPWALPSADSAVGSIFAEAFLACGLNYPRTTISTQTMPARAALAATGSFLSILPSSALQWSTGRSTLKALPIDLPTTHRPTAILRLKRRPLNPTAQLFIDCAREMAELLDNPRSYRRKSHGSG